MATRPVMVWVRFVSQLLLLLLVSLSTVNGTGQIAIVALDARTSEYVCVVTACEPGLIRFCGGVPSIGVVFSGGAARRNCVRFNQCPARDLMVVDMQTPDRPDGFTGQLVATASQECVDPGFQTRLNAAIVLQNEQGKEEAGTGRFVGASTATFNETQRETYLNGDLTVLVMASNATDLATSLEPIEYFGTRRGQNARVSLAERAVEALFSGISEESYLNDCGPLPGTDGRTFTSSATLYFNDTEFLITDEVFDEPLNAIQATMIERIASCLAEGTPLCGGKSNFGNPSTSDWGVPRSCSNACFPAEALVELEDGSQKRMDGLSIGDRVLVENGVYSDVYAFSHNVVHGSFEFTRIETESGYTVVLSGKHYLYLDGRAVVAEKARVGQYVELGSGRLDRVKAVRFVIGRGLVNPQTLQGDIVVNNVRCSTFTRHVEPRLARLLLWPLRLIYTIFGYGINLASPSERLASLMPRGDDSYHC